MATKNKSSQFQAETKPATNLLRQVIEQNAEFTKSVSAHLDVNQTDFEAMEQLIKNGPMTAGQLAKAVGISPGSATVMIDRLVGVGHVTRMPNPKDRRGVLVAPNPNSVAEAWRLISPLITASEQALAELKPSEQDAVTTYLAKMLEVYVNSTGSDKELD